MDQGLVDDHGADPVDEGLAPVDEGLAPVDEGLVDEGPAPVDEGPVDEGLAPVYDDTPPPEDYTPDDTPPPEDYTPDDTPPPEEEDDTPPPPEEEDDDYQDQGNQIPFAGADTVDGTAYTLNAPVTITAASLLANDKDLDGGNLSIIGVTPISGGSVVMSGNDVSFTPTASGTASFNYYLSDGQGGNTVGVVTINNIPGGGGNNAPVFTSGANAVFNVAENSIAAGTVVATDAGDTITYSLTGGLDLALFNIDSGSGAITFKNAPDFETKLDAGTDNVYDVIVTATDTSAATATQSVAITVTDQSESFSIVDGYVIGSSVWQDLNGNGILDSGTETEFETDAEGQVILSGLVAGGGDIIVSGGFDLMTSQDFGTMKFAVPTDLSTLSTTSMITPTSTMMADLINDPNTSLDRAAAEAKVISAFGLDAGTDIDSLNPMEAGTDAAKKLMVQNQMIEMTATAVSKAGEYVAQKASSMMNNMMNGATGLYTLGLSPYNGNQDFLNAYNSGNLIDIPIGKATISGIDDLMQTMKSEMKTQLSKAIATDNSSNFLSDSTKVQTVVDTTITQTSSAMISKVKASLGITDADAIDSAYNAKVTLFTAGSAAYTPAEWMIILNPAFNIGSSDSMLAEQINIVVNSGIINKTTVDQAILAARTDSDFNAGLATLIADITTKSGAFEAVVKTGAAIAIDAAKGLIDNVNLAGDNTTVTQEIAQARIAVEDLDIGVYLDNLFNTDGTIKDAYKSGANFDPNKLTQANSGIDSTLGTLKTEAEVGDLSLSGINKIVGTTGGDTLTGTSNKDIILGRAGDDVIVGNDGNDKLIGNKGNDVLIGGEGKDKLVGGKGDDILIGGKHKDKLIGKSGDDILIGGGDGSGQGGSRVDIMKGGSGADTFVVLASDWSTNGTFTSDSTDKKFVKIKDFSHTDGDVLHFGMPTNTTLNAISADHAMGQKSFTFASITQEVKTTGDDSGDLLIFEDVGGIVGSFDRGTDNLIVVLKGIEFEFAEADITVNVAA